MPPGPPEVIIAGAGIIGASIAWRLAQAGASVTLLDSGGLGGEASWAGAGMLAPGGEIVCHAEWARIALESPALYPAFVEELQQEAGVEIDYRACGALEIASTEQEWQELLARRQVQEQLGICAAPAEAPPGAAGAFFYPDDALVDPRQIMQALRIACQRRGVRIREQTRVSEIGLSSEGAAVETAGGRLTGSAVVLAAGAWSSGIPVLRGLERLEIPTSYPVRGHLLGYRLAPGSLGPILRRGHWYVMQRSSGFTIAGTSSETVGFDRRMDQEALACIRREACELFPRLGAAGEPEAWLGFRPATPDLQPCVGRLDNTQLWLAYGHYRNGILLAPATARRVSQEILSNSETDLTAPFANR